MVSILLMSTFKFSLTGKSLGNFMIVLSMRLTSLGMVLSSYGHIPQSISYKITPKDQMSARISQISPLSTSGAIQMGEPTIVCVISLSFRSYLQKPKSANLITPLWKRILVGLRSLCSMFSACSASKAVRNCVKILIVSCQFNLPLDLICSARVPPLQNSQTRQQLLAVRSISTNLMMLMLFILERMAIQLLVNSLSLGVCLNFSTFITLTAKICLFFRFQALYTFPY